MAKAKRKKKQAATMTKEQICTQRLKDAIYELVGEVDALLKDARSAHKDPGSMMDRLDNNRRTAVLIEAARLVVSRCDILHGCMDGVLFLEAMRVTDTEKRPDAL